MSVLPPRNYSTDEERRLAEAMNTGAENMLKVVDAACRLRTAPGEAKRQRQMMRKCLEDAAAHGLNALAYTNPPKEGA